ncbi:hypothetical protein [Nocardioides hwasunensis]|uniref:Uncharacterized protein n=1 Tax=Nocardioides hwasunensis TaxID=397258 RepID=A0ABR8MJQ7_9ACTN|nr:hypothetical protein [Nocardioides hwasunensis]MBD3916273.1 hypothetical protein [Nocardioides hwasunensis]
MSDATPGAEPTPEPTPESKKPAGPDYGAQASRAAETLKAGNPLDLGIIGAGVVALLASLMPYYTVSIKFMGVSSGGSGNAWDGGFFGWFGALLALAGAGVLVAKILGVTLPVPVRLTVLGLFGGALLCTLVAFFVFPGGGCDDLGITGVCDGIDQGHGIGFWLALLATIAGTALSYLRRSAD